MSSFNTVESSTTDQPQNQRKAVLNLKDRCLCSLFYFFMETLKIKFHERSYFKIKAGLSAVSVVIHKHDCTVLIWQSYYCYFCSIPNFYFFVYPFWFCQMTAPVCAVSTAFLLMFRVFYKLTMSCHYHQVLTLLMKHWKAPVLFCLFFFSPLSKLECKDCVGVHSDGYSEEILQLSSSLLSEYSLLLSTKGLNST